MWKSLIEMLAHQAEAHPDAIFVRFLNSKADPVVYTYGATWQWTLRWAELLADRGVQRGAIVVLALPNTDDFVGAYYGTLLSGGIPVPVYPIRQTRVDDPYTKVIVHRIRFLEARVLVIPEAQANLAANSGLAEVKNLSVLSRRDLPNETKERSPQAKPDDFGLFQFTSGTSGNSKVVQLTHSALMAQTQMVSEALKLIPGVDSAVSWLPLCHDMGLIGFLLTTASVHGTINLMQSTEYMLQPALWIRALSDYAATITGGTPSSYLMVANRMIDSELSRYDLNHLRIALVGAEMVNAQSLNKFAEKFAPIGFRRTSLMPTYGMAESGLAITMPPLDNGPEFDNIDLQTLYDERRFVPPVQGRTFRAITSVGTPLRGIEVAIIGETGARLADRFLGEVIIRSPSQMSGYYRQPELTREALHDGWLYTGDLGYMADGKLYITGRIKDLLIVGGRNYCPEDLEDVARSVPGVDKGRVVAVSYADSELATEAVVLFAETRLVEHDECDALRQNIRKALIGAGYPLSKVVLLQPKTIQFTPNGKLLRGECLNRYLAGDYSIDHETR